MNEEYDEVKYIAGYIYDGNISDLKPCKSFENAEKYILNLIGDQDYAEDDWGLPFASGLNVKHYYIDYNQFFIIKL